MMVLVLHAFVLAIILVALLQAGCATSHVPASSYQSVSHQPKRTSVHIERVYDSPTGPDLYRIETPHGTTYHRQGYVSPLNRDVACEHSRP